MFRYVIVSYRVGFEGVLDFCVSSVLLDAVFFELMAVWLV